MEVKMSLKDYFKSIEMLVVTGFLAVMLLLTACSPIATVEAQPQPTQADAGVDANATQPAATQVVVGTEEESEATQIPVDTAIQTYNNEVYRLAFSYPAEWSLAETSAGLEVNQGDPLPAIVELSKEDYHVLIQINFHWTPFSIGGGLPPGEVKTDGSVSLLGKSIQRNRLVFDSKTKIVWYGSQFDDLDLYVRLEDATGLSYDQVEVPEEVISQAETILASFTRTGEPFAPPTGTPVENPVADDSPGTEVDGWIGTIVSASQWPQIDDYFQLQGQEGGYGITSLDSVIKSQLSSFRDSGTPIRIWGRLFEGRMDAFNSQIEVTRVEVYEMSSSEMGSWVGVVISNPPGAQFDDYFQMMDQNGKRCGIDSLDLTLRDQLEKLRDTEKIVRVWGTMLADVPDAYGCQLQIQNLELE
jgi:hypothetical protein